MCLRVRNVSPECSTWLNLRSWGWGRLHSSVGLPISKRETPNLVDRTHISTHRFSGQKMGGEALVPHSLHDLGSRSSPPHLFLLSHLLALLWPPFEMLVSWHPAFLKTSVTKNALRVAGERSSDHRLHRYRDCYGPSHLAHDHRCLCLHPGMRPFRAPAGGIETVCRGGGRKQNCSIRAVCSQWGSGEI